MGSQVGRSANSRVASPNLPQDYDINTEEWEFIPGDIVEVITKKSKEGDDYFLAVKKIK